MYGAERLTQIPDHQNLGPFPPQQDILPLATQFLGTPHQGPATKLATRERQLIASCTLSVITDSKAFSMQMWPTDQAYSRNFVVGLV
jgi:hypothetical protein